ncbi:MULTISPECIES: hypothetical protein [unclassified Streptomyces]|uniref:hypothetical protein n=1 Tax=unclassified Streptomyces TaxID=2593676 RepID=UPI002E2C01FB|nr:hypothetical protein [Streptomyces sp. NBC_01439]
MIGADEVTPWRCTYASWTLSVAAWIRLVKWRCPCLLVSYCAVAVPSPAKAVRPAGRGSGEDPPKPRKVLGLEVEPRLGRWRVVALMRPLDSRVDVLVVDGLIKVVVGGVQRAVQPAAGSPCLQGMHRDDLPQIPHQPQPHVITKAALTLAEFCAMRQAR